MYPNISAFLRVESVKIEAFDRVSAAMLSYVGEDDWHRRRIWKGLDMQSGA